MLSRLIKRIKEWSSNYIEAMREAIGLNQPEYQYLTLDCEDVGDGLAKRNVNHPEHEFVQFIHGTPGVKPKIVIRKKRSLRMIK